MILLSQGKLREVINEITHNQIDIGAFKSRIYLYPSINIKLNFHKAKDYILLMTDGRKTQIMQRMIILIGRLSLIFGRLKPIF